MLRCRPQGSIQYSTFGRASPTPILQIGVCFVASREAVKPSAMKSSHSEDEVPCGDEIRLAAGEKTEEPK
jgi:hypothetical protein